MSGLSELAEDGNASTNISTRASGLKLQEKRHNLKFLIYVLGALKPSSLILLSQLVALYSAGEVMSASLQALMEMHCNAFWEEHYPGVDSNTSKRKRTMNKQLDDSVVFSTAGCSYSDSHTATPNQSPKRSVSHS